MVYESFQQCKNFLSRFNRCELVPIYQAGGEFFDRTDRQTVKGVYLLIEKEEEEDAPEPLVQRARSEDNNNKNDITTRDEMLAP